MQLRFLAFWAINDRLDEAELFRQLGEMKQSGFDGVVWQPRFYPNAPEYLAILSGVILHAKSLGLDFWIYDENGWPSGTVGGEMLREYPHLRQQWIELVSSGFNAYGPHHHVDGDRHVVSPVIRFHPATGPRTA